MGNADLMELAGHELGCSDWLVVDQGRVNAFADVTLDHQFIHVDPEAAAATPFGGPIAHGFLTLSLLVHLAEQVAVRPENMVMGINYGFDRIRFLSPVPVGSAIRARLTVANVAERGSGQYLVTYDVTVEIQGNEKPALVAQWLSLLVTSEGESR
jgi:acyl dehydratase